MEISIKVNEVKNKDKVKAFATVVFGDSFKITNITVLEGKEGNLYVSMPRYRSNEKDENGGHIYKDICNPITAEFREKLYSDIIEAYEKLGANEENKQKGSSPVMPEFKVTVVPYERENSNIKGLARVYFEDSFVVGNINILQGKEKVFVAMPSYKTKQVDDNGKAVYQDICYPVTKEFRDKLFTEIEKAYVEAKDKQQSENKEKESAKEKDKSKTTGGCEFMTIPDGHDSPFR